MSGWCGDRHTGYRRAPNPVSRALAGARLSAAGALPPGDLRRFGPTWRFIHWPVLPEAWQAATRPVSPPCLRRWDDLGLVPFA